MAKRDAKMIYVDAVEEIIGVLKDTDGEDMSKWHSEWTAIQRIREILKEKGLIEDE